MPAVASARLFDVADTTFYPVEEKVGEDSLQRFIMELLRPMVERWLALRGKPTFVGADQFIYYEQHNPRKAVAPDIYVLPGVEPGHRVTSWKTWQTGIVPSFALEIATSDYVSKDYHEVPDRYAELGVDELVIFDTNFEDHEDRVRFQRYRMLEKRGFVRVESTNGDRIHVQTLGCFLRVVGEGAAARLRLGAGPTGDDLVPTEAEALEAERAAKEAERAAKEAERAAKEEALRQVEELRALVAALRSSSE